MLDLGSIFGQNNLFSSPAQAQDNAGGPAPVPPADTAFTNFFDPSNTSTPFSNIMGTFGKLMGVPTQQQRQSAADAATFQRLTDMYQQTGSPQKAILQFMNTPDGVQLMSRPGMKDTLDRWVKTITPPPPVQYNTPAGTNSQFYVPGQPNTVPHEQNQPPEAAQNMTAGVPNPVTTPGGSTTTNMNPKSVERGSPASISVAPAETQNFVALNGLAHFSQPQLQAIAKYSLVPGASGQMALAIDNIVQNGGMPADVGDKFKAGIYQIVQGTDETGHLTNQFYMVDKSGIGTGEPPKIMPLTPQLGGANGPTMPGQGAQQFKSNTPAAQPYVIPQSAIDPKTGEIDGNTALTDKRFMFTSVGMLNHTVMFLGNILRNIDVTNPDEASKQASAHHDQLDNFEAAVASLASGNNNRLKGVLDKWLELTPNRFTDVVDAYQQAIQLRAHLEESRGYYNNFLYDNSKSEKTRQEARDTISKIDGVLMTMPTLPEMYQVMGDVSSGKQPVMGPGEAIESVGNLVKGAFGKVFGGGGNQQQPPGPNAPSNAQPAGKAQPPASQSQPSPNGPNLPTTTQIRKMSLQDIDNLRKQGLLKKGSPELEAAKSRVNALIAAEGKTTTAPAPKATPYAESSKPKGRSVKDFVQNPDNTPTQSANGNVIIHMHGTPQGSFGNRSGRGNAFDEGEEIMQ